MTEPRDAGQALPAAGWYADPTAPPGRTGRRWWDGVRWSEHVVADPVPGTVGGPSSTLVGPPTTPDGQPTAGWGRRLAAYLIDALTMWVLALAVGFPFVRSLARDYVDFLRQALDASAAGARPPGQLDLYQQIYPQLLGYLAVALVVTVIYQAAFLRTLSATPGKLLLGLRVRLREQSGRLPWATIARRLLVTWVAGIVVGAIPLVGSAVGIYLLVDGLWPLWDAKRQSLHDKVARTAVVRR